MKLKEVFLKGKDKIARNHSLNNELSSMSDYKIHKTLFDNHTDAMLIFNESSQIIAVNKRLISLLGISKKELLSKQIHTLFVNNLDLVNYHIQKALEGKTTSVELTVLDKKVQERFCHLTYLPVSMNEDELGIHVIIKDLSEQKKQEDKIYKLQDNLNEVERIANLGSWEYEIKADTAHLSDQFYSIYNIGTKHFSPSFKNLLNLIHSDDRKKVEQLAKAAINHGTPYEVTYRIESKHGKERLIFHKADVSYDQEGRICRLIGTVQDITEAKLTDKRLKQYEALLRSISNNLGVGMWSFDVKSNQMTYCSEAMENIYGIPAQDFYKDPNICQGFIHPEDLQLIIKKHQHLKNGTEIRHQYRLIVDNKTKWVDGLTIPVLNGEGKLIRIDGIITDISEQKHLQTTIEYIANHDNLTNLPTRRFFEQKLSNMIESAREKHISFAVMSMDLDRFKYINDSLGHNVGDELLKLTSNRIRKICGPNVFLARSDGDEFLLCIKGSQTIDDYINLANEIRQEIENPFFIEDYELLITTCIGVSFYPFDGENTTDLLKSADIALRKAKELGKNNCQIFSPSMDVESFKLYTLERDLRKAVIHEQFFTEYQPKVETKTGKIIGAEALIRWEHLEWGKVSPLEFIPLAEETGLILKIDEWVFRNVCHQLKQWKHKEIPLVPISINISPQMFVKTGIVETIVKILEENDVNPSLIEFEITERTLIRHQENVQSVISELKELGIKFSLDDFGTGYSSLSYLKNLKVDQLKIDKSFIHEIGNDKNTEAIIKSIIFLARELDMKVVAEGVETGDQLTFLAQRECQLIQGYIFSKSLSEKEFENKLKLGFLKPNKSKQSVDTTKNRRNYYRIHLQFPLCSGMTIITFKGKKVDLGQSKALVEDISIGGMRVTTNIAFPVQPDIILEFQTKIMNEIIKITGVIVWTQEVNDGLFQYGIKFNIAEVERDHLSQTLNTFSLKMKNDPLLGGCDFHLESRSSYFN